MNQADQADKVPPKDKRQPRRQALPEYLLPLFELQRRFILSCRVLHADETPLPLLDPGAGKTMARRST